MSEKQDLLDKLKYELKKHIPQFFWGFVDCLIDTNAEVLFIWIRENKKLLIKTIKEL